MEDGSFRLSWKDLLRCLACKLSDEKNKQILFEMDGMLASSELSFTEAYDWLLLRIEQTIPDKDRVKGKMPTSKENIQKLVVGHLEDNTFRGEMRDGHKKILDWCRCKNAPMLTTNNDNSYIPDAKWAIKSLPVKCFRGYISTNGQSTLIKGRHTF